MNKAEELIACLEGEIARRDAIIYAERIDADLQRQELDAANGNLAGMRAELAALKAQEPVACEVYYADDDSFHTITRNKMLIDGYSSMAYVIKPLYAAPVSEAKAQGVVMPEPMKRGDEGGSGEYGAAMIRGYNACLREVARLNAAPVQQVIVPDEMRSLAQRLREYNQNPHHINPMSEAFHILVADAANAISTACVPKEIAAAITWSEHLLFECGALTSTRAPSVHVYNKTFAAVNEARAMLAAAPAAPAADASHVFYGMDGNHP